VSNLSSSLTKIMFSRPNRILCSVGAVLLVCAGLTAIVAVGCRGGVRGAAPVVVSTVHLPGSQISGVLSLGNLRGTPPPSQTKVDLSRFFFGTDPPSPLGFVSPTGLATDGQSVLVCDTGLSTVFRCDPVSGDLSSACERSEFDHPFALDIGPSGDRFVCDRGGVRRCDANGNVQRLFEMADGDFKPAGVLVVDDTVLISNRAAHRIEVFDAVSGQHVRSIGGPGQGPGQFNTPRGMARDSAGNVYVVDVFNNRVQVFDSGFKWLRSLGQPGSGVGSFGRPRDVAVGPDDTVFVTDAFSQRVHVFAPLGTPLLAFGEPGSGIGELTMPSGIMAASFIPQAELTLPPDVVPEYYVLVAEQLNRPGVRVYAWFAKDRHGFDGPSLPEQEVDDAETAGPHWDSESCDTCHDTDDDDNPLPIDLDEAGELCESCHEGHDDLVWAHPVEGSLDGSGLKAPAGWPAPDGEISCVSCHDVKRHCDADASRPSLNRAMLREYDANQRLAFCGKCHAETGGSPHAHVDGQGQLKPLACLFCHIEQAEVPSDGRRQFDAKLHSSSGSCLTCHDQHWDYYPAEHFGRPVSVAVRRRMLARELSERGDFTDVEIRELAAQATRQPAKLPLNDGSIACYTCHNPHHVGLFPPDSVLGTTAVSPTEAANMLRIARPDLCQECHEK